MNAGRFRFGLFEFDAASGELRRNGALVPLQKQPARVLSCLIENSGTVVSREDLCKAIWGTETHVDFERGLNFCIAQVRSVLGDDSTVPCYVRTVPKRGYQFIAPVERVPVDVEQSKKAFGRTATPKRILAGACSLVVLAFVAYAGFRMGTAGRSTRPPILAIVRFDNETGDPGMSRFSDDLTDTLVEQLTALSRERYGVVGNAQILRLPRDQRDLNAIATSLHATYVVLGQVQGDRTQTRILAHLIRLPDQTHLWVARMDLPASDALGKELEASQKIAAVFAPKVIKDSSGSPLPSFPNN
jgi:DNA-binding winged helix-turn-helix (wHTH) protein/TolB-like protein